MLPLCLTVFLFSLSLIGGAYQDTPGCRRLLFLLPLDQYPHDRQRGDDEDGDDDDVVRIARYGRGWIGQQY